MYHNRNTGIIGAMTNEVATLNKIYMEDEVNFEEKADHIQQQKRDNRREQYLFSDATFRWTRY